MDKDRKKLLDAYDDLRVCDVRDGLDALGYHFYGSMSPDLRPLYRTRAYGLAKTVRYLPHRGRIEYRNPRHYRDEYTPYYYKEVCIYPWGEEIEEGDFVVIDQSGQNVGLIGSENSFGYTIAGMRGMVINGGVRDTDEIILQDIPVWSTMVSQPMVQGRLEFESMNQPVCVGGVNVHPGDMVVADGDGVVVVPREIAMEVAQYAHEEHEGDKRSRRLKYEATGRKLDETVL